MLKRFIVSAAAVASLLIALQATLAPSLAEPPASAPLELPGTATTRPVDLPGIHNVVRYTDDIISGAVPEGDAGFETLSRLGIRTIVSVDGAMPDLERARQHGLRYVHLPIGYNGIDETRIAELARAVRDLPGPIYIHCHHGKHRSASAAASAAVLLGRLTPDQGLARMKVSGTAQNYIGLWDAVDTASSCPPAAVDEADNTFPPQWKPSDFVEAMVEIDEITDRLKLIEKAGWQPPADHPDLVPASLAGALADHFRLASEGPYVRAQPQDFIDRMDRDQRLISEIEAGLIGGASREELSGKFRLVVQSCKSCHADYRDKADVAPRRLE